MNQTDQYPQRYDDEISLIDLAATFVRRRRIFYAVFGGVVVFATLYAFLFVGELREYTTLIQLGEHQKADGVKPFEPAASVLATIENRWYPELQATYAEVEGQRLPFGIEPSNPEGTSLIKFVTQASPVFADEIRTYHQKLVDEVSRRQSDLFSRQKRALEQRLESVNDYLDGLSGDEAVGEAAAQAVQIQVELVAMIESLQPAETLVVARQSLEQKGTSKKLILSLAIVLGLMLGIFAAFMAEFVSQVHKSMAEKLPE